MSESDERPKADPRVEVRLPVRISTIDAETDPWTGKTFFRSSHETIANVSRGGAFVTTTETIPPGRRVLVELEMPGGGLVQTLGRVAWSRTELSTSLAPAGGRGPSGIGIEFVGGQHEQRVLLERFLRRSLRRRSESAHPSGVHAQTTREGH